MNEYEVTVNFGGLFGGTTSYTVEAYDEADAEDEALEEAKLDLSVESVVKLD